jgi:hypothetical protein
MYVNSPARDVTHWASSTEVDSDALVSPTMSPLLLTEYHRLTTSNDKLLRVYDDMAGRTLKTFHRTL